MKVRSSRQASFSSTTLRIVVLLAVCLAFRAHISGQPLTIQRIAISGTQRPLQLETKAGGMLETGQVARDVKRLWATGWFADIRILSESTPEGVVLTFDVTERPRYHLRKVRFEPKHFGLPAPLPTRALVDKVSVERAARTFQERLQGSGYRDATVTSELIRVGIHQADVLFRVKEGTRYVVEAVQMSGASPADSPQVARILREVQPRTLLPGIPWVWKGWRLHPQLDEQALDLTLQKLRSSYISQGYLDATTSVESLTFEEDRVSISARLVAGVPYQLAGPQISDGPTSSSGNFPPIQSAMKKLCDCLIDRRAQAERSGIADFGAQLLVRPSENEEAWGRAVSLSARIQTGPSYRVGRIEFRGNHHLSDRTLRRALLLSESERFDHGLLRRSLTRLNLTGLIHPVSESDVEVQRDFEQRSVDVVISVREKDKGQWLLGAPAWPGLTGSSSFSIATRLPAWGPSFLELPTHFIAMNLTSPLAGLPLLALNRPRFSFSLTRPYLPGQEWRSGFQVSLHGSWVSALLGSSLLQVRPRLAESLQTAPSLEIPVQWSTTDESRMRTVGVLICNPPRERHARLFRTLRTATDWIFATGL